MLMMIKILFIIALATVGYCGNHLAFEMYKKTGNKKYMVAHIVVLCALFVIIVCRFEGVNAFAELI